MWGYLPHSSVACPTCGVLWAQGRQLPDLLCRNLPSIHQADHRTGDVRDIDPCLFGK